MTAGCLRALRGHNPKKLRGEIQAPTGKTVALSDVPSVAAASDSVGDQWEVKFEKCYLFGEIQFR